MDSAIVAAIIGAVAMIFVGFRKDISNMFTKKKRDVSGNWNGKAKYSYDPDKKIHNFTAKLWQKGNRYKGEIVSDSNTVYTVYGLIKETEYITIIIEHLKPSVVNYGLGLLKYSRDSRLLKGNVFARGRHHDEIFIIELELNHID